MKISFLSNVKNIFSPTVVHGKDLRYDEVHVGHYWLQYENKKEETDKCRC